MLNAVVVSIVLNNSMNDIMTPPNKAPSQTLVSQCK